MLLSAQFVPDSVLPKPIIFGYNYMVAVETFKEFRKQPEFSCVDSIILWGSSVKPTPESKGKDIDLVVFLKGNISWQQGDKAERKLRGIMADSCRKFGVHFDSLLFPSTIINRTEQGAKQTKAALRGLKRAPHRILFASQRSWVKSYLRKMKTRPTVIKFPKKKKPGTRFPLPRKPGQNKFPGQRKPRPK